MLLYTCISYKEVSSQVLLLQFSSEHSLIHLHVLEYSIPKHMKDQNILPLSCMESSLIMDSFQRYNIIAWKTLLNCEYRFTKTQHLTTFEGTASRDISIDHIHINHDLPRCSVTIQILITKSSSTNMTSDIKTNIVNTNPTFKYLSPPNNWLSC